MNLIRSLSLAAAVTSLAGLATAAHAALIDSSSNNPYSFTWNYNTGTSILSGTGSMSLSGFNSSALTVSASLTNTSVIGGIGGERLVGFGFGIDPNATAVSFSDTNDGGMVSAGFASGALPANVQGIEICAWGGNNCSGGGNGGIYAGSSDSFSIVLAGNWGSSVNVEPIGFRYQTGYGSFEFGLTPPPGGNPPVGTPPGRTPPTGTAPEPGTLTLLGLGLAGLAASRRRRQQIPR